MSARPLVIYHKQIGDVLLLEPALAKLADAMKSDVLLATRPIFSPMLSLMDHVIPVPEASFCRASRVISFEHRPRACIQSLMTWCREKELIVTQPKFLRPWHAFFFPSKCSSIDPSVCYRAEYFFNAIPVISEMAFRPPRLHIPPPDWTPDTLPETYVLVHATSAWKNKSWTVDAWAKAIDSLSAQGVGPFVITGGGAAWEVDYVKSIITITRTPLIDLCGKTDLQGYMATVAGASMVLCIDGSASHLAAAFGCPSLTLFGPSHPLHWHFPKSSSIVIDAREFSEERKPSVSNIPWEFLVERASELWGDFVG